MVYNILIRTRPIFIQVLNSIEISVKILFKLLAHMFLMILFLIFTPLCTHSLTLRLVRSFASSPNHSLARSSMRSLHNTISRLGSMAQSGPDLWDFFFLSYKSGMISSGTFKCVVLCYILK